MTMQNTGLSFAALSLFLKCSGFNVSFIWFSFPFVYHDYHTYHILMRETHFMHAVLFMKPWFHFMPERQFIASADAYILPLQKTNIKRILLNYL